MDKVQSIILHAYDNFKFYNDKLKGIVSHSHINLSNLPIIRKDEMRTFLHDEGISVTGEGYGIFQTSSCGRDVFLYARPMKPGRFPRMAFCFQKTGMWKMLDPWLKLTSLNCIENVNPLNKKAKRKGTCTLIPPSEDYLRQSKETMQKLHNLISRSGARLIHANPSYLKMLLAGFRKHDLELKGRYAVNSTYELLTDSTEKYIKENLDCEVFDQYGCSEFGPISYRCKEGNYHVFSDYVHVEVVPAPDLGRRDIGRVVVTDLNNKVMPFIRYYNGDLAFITPSKCGCGSKMPLMGRPVGREDETVEAKGGIMTPFEIDDCFDMPGILMYQVGAKERLLNILPSREVDLELIQDGFRRKTGLRFKARTANTLKPHRRGKYRLVKQ